MADLKISQLPAATTPLAGTEVLPIVQSGSTVQVSVTNVLAGAASLGANIFTAAQDWATGANIASATTINLNIATGNRVHITGTTAITTVTLTRGPRTLIFDGILTLTHNATTNNLPGGVNITTAAGDRAIYESDGTTVYCVAYIPASGKAVINPVATATTSGLVPTPPNNTTTFLRGDATFATPSGALTLGTPVASTSGTSIDFTGLPSGITRIVVSLDGVSTNGTSRKLIQLGDSGGIETGAYVSGASWLYSASLSGANSASGFLIKSENAGERLRGSMTIVLVNSSTNTWAASGVFGDGDFGDSTFTSGGSKAISAVLDRVRITTINGTDTFDAGQINIAYE